MVYVMMIVLFAVTGCALYKIGNSFGFTAGYRKARAEFDAMIDDVRKDEQDLAEAVADVKKQVAGIEKIGKRED